MKIAYGYRRAPKSFQPYGVDHIWGDKTPERPELAAIMGAGGKEPAVHAGDILILLHHADIGDDWRQRRRVLIWLAGRGVSVQVREQAPVLYDSGEKLATYKDLNGGDRTQRDPGRPTKIKWAPEKAKEFAAVWYGPFSRGYAGAEFERITGKRFDQRAINNVNYLFGSRDGSKKERFNRLIEEFGSCPSTMDT